MARTKKMEVERQNKQHAGHGKKSLPPTVVAKKTGVSKKDGKSKLLDLTAAKKSKTVVEVEPAEKKKRRRGYGNRARQRIYALQKEDAVAVLQKADFNRLLHRVQGDVGLNNISSVSSNARECLQFVLEGLLVKIIMKAGERTLERDQKMLRMSDFLALRDASQFVVDPEWIPTAESMLETE